MKSQGLTIFLILLVVVFGIHSIYRLAEGARVDLTSTQLYSLTDGTQDIIQKMKDEGVKPIEVKLYFSATNGKTLPAFIKNFITYNDYVRNLIREYERAADGKIRFTTFDPKTDSDDEQDAGDFGLDGKQINSEGDKFFFGLVFETQTGSRDVIDFLWPEKQETIEYEISKRIYSLLWPEKNKIGIISSLEPLPDNNPYMMQMMQMQGRRPSEPWIMMTLLQETYDVEMITDAQTISKEEYDLLMVIHPKNLGDKELWAINEWVVTGGDTMVFLDNYALADEPPANPQNQLQALQQRRASNLERLLDQWGVSMTQDEFVADYNMATRTPTQTGGSEMSVVYLTVTEENSADVFDSESPILNGLNNVTFFMSGALDIKDDAPATVTPLITTTDAGSRLNIAPGFGGAPGQLSYIDMMSQPTKLLDAYEADARQNLAVLINGKLPSVFPDGATFPKETPAPPAGMPPGMQMPTPEDAEMVTMAPIPEEQLAESRVLVFADLDFINDRVAFQQSFFGVQATNDNHKVVLNAVDFMVGARELMDVRSKKQIRRPFKVFDEIERKADADMLEEEKGIRAQIEAFNEELRAKQSSATQKDAALMDKQLSEDIEAINAKIDEGNKRLREIRKAKRSALEGTENTVRFIIVALMPIIVCVFGIMVFIKRRGAQGKRG